MKNIEVHRNTKSKLQTEEFGKRYMKLCERVFKNKANYDDITEEFIEACPQLSFYGINYIGGIADITKDNADMLISVAKSIDMQLSFVTYGAFEAMFPLNRVTNGVKANLKDFLKAKSEFSKFDANEMIGENVSKLLCDYCHPDIRLYAANRLKIYSESNEDFIVQKIPVVVKADVDELISELKKC